MKMKLTLAAFTLICVGVFVVSSALLHHQIKITTVQLRQQQMGEGIERLSKYINADAKLKDRVRVRTYPAAQLYTGRKRSRP